MLQINNTKLRALTKDEIITRIQNVEEDVKKLFDVESMIIHTEKLGFNEVIDHSFEKKKCVVENCNEYSVVIEWGEGRHREECRFFRHKGDKPYYKDEGFSKFIDDIGFVCEGCADFYCYQHCKDNIDKKEPLEIHPRNENIWCADCTRESSTESSTENDNDDDGACWEE